MVDTFNRTACLPQKADDVVLAMRMNLRRMEKRESLTPLQRLAGKKNPHLLVEGVVFLLTSLFIERGYRPSEF